MEEADARSPATSTGTRVPDGAEGAREAGFRTWGKSKDHRDDLPQVVIGMAVTRDGIPLRVWCRPGRHRRLRPDPAGQGRPAPLDAVAGHVGRRPRVHLAENRRYLRRGGDHYIIGERLRSGSAEADAALSRQGRYQEVAGNLQVREVRIAEDERFVICHNPEGAERDAAIRARMIAQLKELIDNADAAEQGQAGGAAGRDLDETRAEPLPARHPRRPPPHRRRPRPRPRRTSTASTSCAPPTRR